MMDPAPLLANLLINFGQIYKPQGLPASLEVWTGPAEVKRVLKPSQAYLVSCSWWDM